MGGCIKYVHMHNNYDKNKTLHTIFASLKIDFRLHGNYGRKGMQKVINFIQKQQKSMLCKPISMRLAEHIILVFLVFSVISILSLYLLMLLCVKYSMLMGAASHGTVIAYVYLYSN